MNGIYQYRDLKTDEIVYIGKDNNIDKNTRHKDHLSPSKYDKQVFNRVLQNNKDRYQYEIIYGGNYSNDMLNTLELNTIAEFKRLHEGNRPKFNFTDGGEGSRGHAPSSETLKKRSKSLSGENHYLWNQHHPFETTIKMSKSHNTTGYYRVSKDKTKRCKQGFIYKYKYYENKKRNAICSVNLDELEQKVKEKNLPWFKLQGDE